MAIVTISSELGAGGSEIGAALAKQLEYRYLDREVIAGAANRYGLAEAKLLRLDESKPSLFDRVDSEGRLYVAGNRLPADAEAASPAVSDVADIPRQPCPRFGRPRLLHGSYRALARPLRARRTRGRTGRRPPKVRRRGCPDGTRWAGSPGV